MDHLQTKLAEVGTHVPLATRAHDELALDSPLMKVPVLVTEDGKALYDSRVICEYLDQLSSKTTLFPPNGQDRWRALKLQSLADGMMDAAILCRFEAARDPSCRSNDWTKAQTRRIVQGLDVLNKEMASLKVGLTIGIISVACALSYLDFRFAHLCWRQGHEMLAAWLDEFSDRPSMRLTRPSRFLGSDH